MTCEQTWKLIGCGVPLSQWTAAERVAMMTHIMGCRPCIDRLKAEVGPEMVAIVRNEVINEVPTMANLASRARVEAALQDPEIASDLLKARERAIADGNADRLAKD